MNCILLSHLLSHWNSALASIYNLLLSDSSNVGLPSLFKRLISILWFFSAFTRILDGFFFLASDVIRTDLEVSSADLTSSFEEREMRSGID